MRRLGEGLDKKLKNEGKFTPHFNSTAEDAYTSRRIYIEDYKLLREMSFVAEKKITEILDEMLAHYEKSIFTISKLDNAINHKSKADTNKAIKVPVQFNEYLLNKAPELNTNAKKLLSAMIQDYYSLKMDK